MKMTWLEMVAFVSIIILICLAIALVAYFLTLLGECVGATMILSTRVKIPKEKYIDDVPISKDPDWNDLANRWLRVKREIEKRENNHVMEREL